MIRNALQLFLIAALASCAQKSAPTPQATKAKAASDESFRATRPQPGEPLPLEIPLPEVTELENGLKLYVLHKPELPLVHARLVFRSGSAHDAKNRLGQAGFVSAMLTNGTKSRSATEIAAEIEYLGTSVGTDVSEDDSQVSVTALTQNFEKAFDILADVVQHPNFQKEEIARVRDQRLAALKQSSAQPAFVAKRVFREAVLGSHPYSHVVLGTQTGLERMGRSDLLAYFRTHYRPSNAALVLVGDITPEDGKKLSEKYLGKWNAPKAKDTTLAEAKVNKPRLVLVDRPDAPQSQLRIGHLGVPRSHPDYFALVLSNAILGGLFSSRINMNLREDKGYTYGARSGFSFNRTAGPFSVRTGVKTEVTLPAIEEVVKEIKTFHLAKDITKDELENARSAYAESLPGYFETAEGIGGMLSNLFVHKLPLDYYANLTENLRSVTLEDVQRVAKDHFKPEELTIVVVGDRKKVEPTLSKLGDFEVRSEDGKIVGKKSKAKRKRGKPGKS